MKFISKRFLALLVCFQATVASPAGAEEGILPPYWVNLDAGWALNRVGKEISKPATDSYYYPNTTVPVRLYLIDTGISDPASFQVANPKLTFEGSIPIGGAVSVPRPHGTQLLSLIAGQGTGVASGTPIHVVNYDIYTASEAVTTTTFTNLATAINSAIQHHRTSANPMRAAICIATSSGTLSRSYPVEDAINVALSEGIPVIVSAGNLGAEIPTFTYNANGNFTNYSYVPSAYGAWDGVICVGATDQGDAILSGSNFGPPVDIFAPGFDVRSRNISATSPYIGMTGTSASAALVAGSVLAELSINGSLTPAQVENAIKASAVNPETGPRLLRTTYASALTIHNPDGPIIPSTAPVLLSASASPSGSASTGITSSLDADSDGFPDMVETFHSGSNHNIPAPAVVTRTGDMVQFKFPISFNHFRWSDPFTLANGYRWKIECTTEARGWDVPEGSLSKTTDAKGQAWLVATFPAGQSFCYARIGIVAP